jgi:hypothetical protein
MEVVAAGVPVGIAACPSELSNVPQTIVDDREAWELAHFDRGTVLCRRIDHERVALVEPEGRWMHLSPDEVTPILKPTDLDIIIALSGMTSDDLLEVSDFTCSPRTTQEIEEHFPHVQVPIIRNLGMLQEAGKKGGRTLFRWEGWTESTITRALDNLIKRSPTRMWESLI